MIPFLKILLGVPLVFFLPGYTASAAFLFRGTSARRFSLPDALYIQILLSILITSITAFILAVAGIFSLSLLLAILAAFTVAPVILSRRGVLAFRYQWDPPSARDAILIGTLAIAALLFFQPFEYLRGGQDQGAYTNEGISISRTGSITVLDGLFASLSVEDQHVFSHKRNNIWQRFPGFITADPEHGKIALAFYHLYPVWIAVFHSLFGLQGAFYVNPALGIISVLGIFVLSKTHFHKTVGLLAAFLLTINLAQIWYARFPTTEILAQLLITGALVSLAFFLRRESKHFATLSALLFCSAFLARIDIVLILPVIGLFFYCRSFTPEFRRDLHFIIPFFVSGLFIIFYYLTAASTPTAVIFRIFSPASRLIIIVLMIVAALVLAIIRAFPSPAKSLAIRISASQSLRLYLATAIAILFLFAYFVRPYAFTGRNAANLVELGWFLTPLGLFTALAGLLWIIRRDLSVATVVFAGILLSFSVFFVYGKLIHPEYMWAIRRFLPVVIPGACILIAFTIWKITAWKNRPAYAVSLLLLCAISAMTILAGRHILIHREYRGFAAFCRDISRNFSPDDIVVCDDYWLAEPLYFSFGVNALSVSDLHDPRALRKCARAIGLMDQWLQDGKRVFFMTHGDPIYVNALDFRLLAESSYTTAVLDKSRTHIPTEFGEFSPTVRIYEAFPVSPENPPDREQYTIDIGYSSFGLLKGFYRLEKSGRGDDAFDYRWTDGNAAFVIPWLGADSGQILTIRMSGGRPEGMEPPNARILADGQLIGEATLSNGFREYTFTIPAGTVATRIPGRATITITSGTWVPAETSETGDDRSLGVQIDWVKISRQESGGN